MIFLTLNRVTNAEPVEIAYEKDAVLINGVNVLLPDVLAGQDGDDPFTSPHVLLPISRDDKGWHMRLVVPVGEATSAGDVFRLEAGVTVKFD